MIAGASGAPISRHGTLSECDEEFQAGQFVAKLANAQCMYGVAKSLFWTPLSS